MARYLSHLVEYIKQITSIDTKFSSHIDVLHLKCAKEDNKNEKPSLIKKPPEDIFSKGKVYWIQGGTGSGKTPFTIYKVAQSTEVY